MVIVLHQLPCHAPRIVCNLQRIAYSQLLTSLKVLLRDVDHTQLAVIISLIGKEDGLCSAVGLLTLVNSVDKPPDVAVLAGEDDQFEGVALAREEAAVELGIITLNQVLISSHHT